MYQDKIEYLKRLIKRTYKRYVGERKDGTASLKDVASFFNIPIDESREEDYEINKINFEKPFLELIDKKTNTTYISEYTSDAKLLNYYSGYDLKYNCLKTITPTHQTESLYYIGDEKPIIEKMTFKDGDYDLEFEREYPNRIGLFINNGIQFTISYSKKIKHKERDIDQILLTKIYKEYNYEKNYDTFEHFYTYGPTYRIKRDDSQEKYTYINNNNIIYGISELSQRDYDYNIMGICFEKTNVNIDDYFPMNMNAKNYPALKNKNNSSAMIFNGYIKGSRHLIEIYKNGNEAVVNYTIKENNETINEEFIIPLINIGNITSAEIQIIITELQDKYSNNDFIALISNELMKFKDKIDIMNDLIKEDYDLLNPKLYIYRSFSEIAKIVDNNYEELFKLASEQFKTATNIYQTDEKGNVKILKANNNS